MRRVLTALGYAATTAGSAAEGLARFDAHDVATIDLGLPDRPGRAMVPEIRRRGTPTRVAVWPASTGALLLAEAAAAAGVDAVFNKPSDLEKLLAWIGGGSSGGDKS